MHYICIHNKIKEYKDVLLTTPQIVEDLIYTLSIAICLFDFDLARHTKDFDSCTLN